MRSRPASQPTWSTQSKPLRPRPIQTADELTCVHRTAFFAAVSPEKLQCSAVGDPGPAPDAAVLLRQRKGTPELIRAYQDLQSAYQASSYLHRHAAAEDLPERILKAVADAVDVDRLAVFRLRADGGLARLAALGGRPDQPMRVHRAAVARSARDQVALASKWGENGAGEARPFACAPARTPEHLLGVIYVDREPGAPMFSQDELQLVSAIARAAGYALETHEMLQTIAQRDGELEQARSDLEGRLVELQHENQQRRATEERLQSTVVELARSHESLQTAQLQLIQAEKLKSVGRLAAGVAHEVKNPLMTLLLGLDYVAEFVDMAVDEGSDVASLIGDMRGAVERANTIIEGLLDFSAPRKLEMRPHALDDIVREALSLTRHELARARVQPSVRSSAALEPTPIDRPKLVQVLVNLIVNAAHATDPGGTIEVAVGSETDEGGRPVAVIEVLDSGSGIAPERIEKIFDPFFTTKPAGEGSGLGLAVARQIVELHGGSIRLENRSEGGVRAVLTVPQAERRVSWTPSIAS